MTDHSGTPYDRDRPRRKDSEYDPTPEDEPGQHPRMGVARPQTAADQLREIYATDPDDPGPGRVNARHRW